MPEVGVRELKTHASEVVRNVRDHRARYVITYRRRPVAVLLPLDEVALEEATVGDQQGTNVWDKLIELGEEIGQGWQSPYTSGELLSDMRR